MDEANYPITNHLKDLRAILVRSMLWIGAGLIVCIAFADRLIDWLLGPVRQVMGEKTNLIVLTPHEYFFTEMKAALVGGILLASPWIFYQIWCFAAPGLYRHEKKMAFSFVAITALCFVGGILFAQHFVFPSVFNFFIESVPEHIQGNYSIGLLFSFTTNLLLAFGLVFETPVLVFLLAYFNLVELSTLRSGRRYVIVLAFIVAAVLTPTPDPLTQTLMAVPIILLYELGIFWARMAKFRFYKITNL
ncbi:MAG: twin-arginine translocase subunit TatC [Deltaproteobacteria bacterium]|nr:twin-arginine translocase subunit TatC [Deltaproteobacteria bacterium]